MNGMPHEVTLEQCQAALDALGIPHTDVISVEIGVRQVTVRTLMYDVLPLAANSVVEQVTHIPIGR